MQTKETQKLSTLQDCSTPGAPDAIRGDPKGQWLRQAFSFQDAMGFYAITDVYGKIIHIIHPSSHYLTAFPASGNSVV
jgi:hypothetical protein